MESPDLYFGQVEQDKFVCKITKNRKNGTFLEIGSNHPKNLNNTYLLETNFNWRGIMVEYDNKWLPFYKQYRKNSCHIIDDAVKVDYLKTLQDNKMPYHIDYLQIDLEENNGSTLNTLLKLDNNIFDKYKFAVVTFEHDIYRYNHFDTRKKSREIFKKRGYFNVFNDIKDDNNPFEDWYVHPELVDMDYVNYLKEVNKKNYTSHNITGKALFWKDIIY